MNSYIFFGIPFLLFGLGLLVLDNNTITSLNPFNLFDVNHLPSNFYSIPLANAQEHSEEGNINNNNKINENTTKYVILIFDRGYKSTFTKAKPILDKYDFKVSVFVACSQTESPKGMTWD
jgi:peptidoglycan/xylan/chitin deacetylase (PgdA/CDA1 family)